MNERELQQLSTQWARGIRDAVEKEGQLGDQAGEPAATAPTPSEPPRKRSLRLLNNVPPTTNDDFDFEVRRPKTRADCLEMERPCPFVSCKYHLYIDVSREGVVTLAVPDLELWEMIDTCSLDVAEEGSLPGTGEGDGQTLEAVALIYGLSRERIRQVEAVAQRKLRKRFQQALPEYVTEYGQVRRRVVVDVDEVEDGEEGDEEDGDS